MPAGALLDVGILSTYKILVRTSKSRDLLRRILAVPLGTSSMRELLEG